MSIRNPRPWHQRFGMVAATFVLLMATTGIALNHGHGLGLDRHHVTAPWVLAWYGLAAPEPGPAYRAGAFWFSQWDGRLFVDDNPVGRYDAPLRGALAVDDILLVVLADRVLLVLPDGRLVDELGPAAGVPAGVKAVGTGPDARPYLRTGGAGPYRADIDLTRWEPATTAEVDWRRPRALPEAVADAVERGFRGDGVVVERLLLDLHSGRVLGPWGSLLFDLFGLFSLGIATSGLAMAIRRRRSAA